jgi:hypothetical protein
MYSHFKLVFILGCLSLLSAGTASADQGVSVKITNDGTQDIIVTVYDDNAGPGIQLLTNEHINGFTSVPVSAVGDASGRAKLRWTATSTDGTSTKCGHATAVVGNDGTVSVHADSDCSV